MKNLLGSFPNLWNLGVLLFDSMGCCLDSSSCWAVGSVIRIVVVDMKLKGKVSRKIKINLNPKAV